ncbi:MAG: hypothetical protein ACTHPD_00330 [Rhizomicrobium sp.]
MTDETWLDPAKGPSDKEIAFDYIKAPDFRVVWVDGAIGSITPNGIISFVLFAERPAIPRRQVYALEAIDDETAVLGEERTDKRISRQSVVREMACNVFISPEAAKDLIDLLQHQIRDMAATKRTDNLQAEK